MSEMGAIEQAILEAGHVNEEAWNIIKGQTATGRKSAWKTAITMGFVSEAEALKIISRKFNIPFLDADKIPESTFDISTADVSPSFLSENRIYPIRTTDDEFEVAVCDPASIPMAEAIFVGSEIRLKVYLAIEEALHKAVEQSFGKGASMMDNIIEHIGEAGDTAQEVDEDPDHLSDLASGAPVIRLVNLIISRAVEAGASDIHLEPFEKELVVRYRIDGVLHHSEAPPKKMQSAVISRVKIMAHLNIAEKRLPQDGRIRTRIGGKNIDMRVSTLPAIHGESVVMRILDRSSVMVDLNHLGFPLKELENFNSLILKPYGMLLVTGPTGSGKTTTLYAALDKINSTEKKIITIEDPVEYQMKGINQIQVNSKIGLSFNNGLRSIVRQDPDVLMVGEIRDFETAEIAIQASLTGHMVFSTVHTNDSAGAITRLADMGIEHYLLSSALIGVMAQRLVRKLCVNCRKPAEPDSETLKLVGGSGTLFRENGCPECARTGYRGRKAIFELLLIDDPTRNLILKKTSAHIIKEKARGDGMTTLREDGFAKVREGMTSISEVLRVTAEEVI